MARLLLSVRPSKIVLIFLSDSELGGFLGRGLVDSWFVGESETLPSVGVTPAKGPALPY